MPEGESPNGISVIRYGLFGKNTFPASFLLKFPENGFEKNGNRVYIVILFVGDR